jgi:arsenate reductase-like glutaredoxin family protein
MLGLEVETKDIIREPPPREFLERHVDPERFLEFVSTRSPALKGRPLPRSKKEALDLMAAQPALIKRPILIKGSRVVFGFDKDAYTKLAKR